MSAKQERENKIVAALSTVGVNVLILLLMIFFGSWNTGGSGQGEYPGIEVNLGYDDQGSGDIEPKTPIGTTQAKSNEVSPEDQVQQSNPPPVVDTEAEETSSKISQSNTVTDPNSDVEIKEEKKDVKPAEKVVDKKPVEKVIKPIEKPVETPKVDPKAVYQGKKTSSSASENGSTDGKQGIAGNQGDDIGKEGNKGVPDGTEGAAVYKGRPGGGDGGTGLDLYGWNWDNIPKPVTPDNELPGRIVFLIEVNEDGELVGYKKDSGTVSAAAERACVAAIQKLTFTKKSGAKVPPISKGKITFVIRSK
jgi:protein TonB